MVDMLERAQSWLAGIREEYLATERTLEYVRRDGTVLTLTRTTIGSYDETDDPNVDRGILRVERRDYLVPQQELPGGVPLEGEIFRETAGPFVYTFEVANPPGEPEWTWHDRERTVYRIHTQEVDVGQMQIANTYGFANGVAVGSSTGVAYGPPQ